MDSTNTLSFAAAVDPLRAANRHAGRRLFDWQFATPTNAEAVLTSGLPVPAAPLHHVAQTDLLIIVAGFGLAEQSTPRLLAGIRRLAANSTPVAGIDGGPWLMARAGILDQRNATTHWEDLEKFAQTFPSVNTLNARYVISDNRMTCGGAAPAIEMMLHLIRDQHGPALASKVAGSFIFDTGAAPSHPQVRAGGLPHNAVTGRAQVLMEATLDHPLTLREVAARLGLTPRALQLHFAQRLATTPQAHYLDLRLSEAERLVRQTDMSLQDIALSTGFNSQSSFARAFRARFGRSARSLRQAAQ